MNPYSQDLRDRVLAAVQAGQQTQAAIAETFGISLSTLEKWVRRKRQTGQATPLPQRHGRPRALRAYAALIRTEVQHQPDVTLVELCARVTAKTGLQASPSMMCRELQQLRLPRKKRRFTTVNAKHSA
jgi:transposase